MSVLTSDDGLTWRVLARRPFDGQFPLSMTLVDGRLIVMAARRLGPESFETVVWSSDDGRAWEVWVEPEGGRHPRSFARIRDRWLMQSEYAGGIQSSLDGIDWTTDVPMHPGARSAGFVVGPAGILAPVSTEGQSGRNRTSMHFSADGSTWVETVLEDGSDVRLDRAGASETGYVAIGVVRMASGFESIAWWSRDGMEWERSVVPDDFGRSQYFAEEIISYRGGLIARVNPYDEGPPRILWSSDDRAWDYVDGGPDVIFGGTALLADGDRLLYFGRELTDPETRTLWEGIPVY